MIGVVHRRKRIAGEGSRPTLIAIKEDGSDRVVEHKLTSETDELDFILGRFPVSWRSAESADMKSVRPHHIKWKKLTDHKEPSAELVKVFEGNRYLADKVPFRYDGVRSGDRVFSVLGGSGDAFCYAVAKQSGVEVFRLTPATLKDRRDDESGDHRLLLRLAQSEPDLFYQVLERDLLLIKLRNAYRDRMDAVKVRVACQQRLWHRSNTAIFLNSEATWPEGRVEDEYLARKANSSTLSALEAEEKARENELKKLIGRLEVYEQISPLVKGLGPMTAARIIVAVGDIRRFPSPAKFRAFCGVHVFGSNGKKLAVGDRPPEGKGVFPRRRRGEVADWSGEARQGFYLLVADQFSRQKDAYWGCKLRRVRAKLQMKHPEPELKLDSNGQPVIRGGKPVYDYTPGHLWAMAIQRTVTIFATWLFWQWWRVEKGYPPKMPKDYDEVMSS